MEMGGEVEGHGERGVTRREWQKAHRSGDLTTAAHGRKRELGCFFNLALGEEGGEEKNGGGDAQGAFL